MRNNKICVITGCNSGIGKFTAIELAKLGYEIFMLVRDSEKSRNAYREIKMESGSELVQLIYIDLASLDSIKNSADELSNKISKIDLLINNAGIFKRKETVSIVNDEELADSIWKKTEELIESIAGKSTEVNQ